MSNAASRACVSYLASLAIVRVGAAKQGRKRSSVSLLEKWNIKKKKIGVCVRTVLIRMLVPSCSSSAPREPERARERGVYGDERSTRDLGDERGRSS